MNEEQIQFVKELRMRAKIRQELRSEKDRISEQLKRAADMIEYLSKQYENAIEDDRGCL